MEMNGVGVIQMSGASATGHQTGMEVLIIWPLMVGQDTGMIMMSLNFFLPFVSMKLVRLYFQHQNCTPKRLVFKEYVVDKIS